MFGENNLKLTSPFPVTFKHELFKSTDGSSKKKPFTYKNHLGQVWAPTKKTYSYYDPTERDDKGKYSEPQKAAVLKVDSSVPYVFEDYETNEYERLAYIEQWPSYEAYDEILKATPALQTEMAEVKKAQARLDDVQQKTAAKITNVITNYKTMWTSYGQLRTEVKALVVELPVLKDSPFSTKYLLDFLPVVENLAKIEFPNLMEDPIVAPPAPVPVPPKPTAEATATGV
jgi:hypothetical protein